MSRFNYERQSLVPSISELSSQTQRQYDQENLYATSSQAFYDQNLFSFVSDEVHAMMQIMCCSSRWCAHFYNPLYLLIYGILYLLTLPGAALHYLLLDCVPVRCTEYPEERELRSQGIYTAVGISFLSLPFDIYNMVADDDREQVLISAMSFVVNLSIIILNFVALKAVADGLNFTMRVYIVSVWSIDAILIGLTLFDLYTDYNYITATDACIFALRVLQIFVYTVIGAQCQQFWDMYSSHDVELTSYGYSTPASKKSRLRDSCLAAIEVIIGLVIVANFVYVIVVVEEDAWRVAW